MFIFSVYRIKNTFNNDSVFIGVSLLDVFTYQSQPKIEDRIRSVISQLMIFSAPVGKSLEDWV
jgi:hypothetical protein